jgi:hypothetical protein
MKTIRTVEGFLVQIKETDFKKKGVKKNVELKEYPMAFEANKRNMPFS